MEKVRPFLLLLKLNHDDLLIFSLFFQTLNFSHFVFDRKLIENTPITVPDHHDLRTYVS